jgi:hypothetical protein
VKRRLATALTAGVAVSSVTGLVGAAAPVRADAASDPSLVAQHGFGDSRNGIAWSAEWFRGKLYVGTGRMVNCIQNQVVDFYLVVSEAYKTRPISGERCPPNPYDMNLRAEIWQYTPTTQHWRMVFKSPNIRNPRARGKFVGRDVAFRGMAVYRDSRGRKRLYIGSVTANEYIPELKRRYPPRILSTRDGVHFRETPAKNLIGRTPNGIRRPIGFRSMQVWRGRLYVSASSTLTGQGAVFEVIRPWSRRARFKQVTPSTLSVFETEVFAGHLYAGTGDRATGYGVYRIGATRRHPEGKRALRRASRALRGAHRAVRRTEDGRASDDSAHRRVRRADGRVRRARHRVGRAYRRYAALRYYVRPIVTGGAGRGGTATSVVAMKVFRNRLYVGSSGWYNEEVPISELIRVDRRGRWQVVAGAPRQINGVTRGPVSGLGDGFYNIFSAHFWRMAEYHGALYVTTNDWSYLVRTIFPHVEPWLAGALQSALAGEYGFDVWASCNGRDWFPVTRNAFGQSNMLDFGGRNLVPSPAGLFIGTANHVQGVRVWRNRVGACSTLVGDRRRRHALKQRRRAVAPSVGIAAPRGLLTDAQRAGNIVSWLPTGGVERYRVMRAEYESLKLTLADTPVMPDGFMLETQVPEVVPPGTPGAREVELPVLRDYTTIATARQPFYVDRTSKRGRRYAYRVIAVGASGDRSPPSAVQTAPDPRPPPTFAQLARMLGASTPSGKLALAARAQSDRGRRKAQLRMLAQLKRSVDPDSDAGGLADRLQRHIRYAAVAGGH